MIDKNKVQEKKMYSIRYISKRGFIIEVLTEKLEDIIETLSNRKRDIDTLLLITLAN
jgi:hypothetical protein